MMRVSKGILAAVLLVAGCGAPQLLPRLAGSSPSTLGAHALPAPIVDDIPSPNFNDRPGSKIDTVVWHHTSGRGSATNVGHYFQSPSSGVSSHYIVDRSGSIVRCVPDGKRAWHAGKSAFHGQPNVNDFSIGIEICNVGDGVEPYSNAQVEAIIRLTAYILDVYGIPQAGITRHRDVALPAGRKDDTSDNFPLAYARDGVRAILAGEPLPPRPEPAPPAGYDPGVRFYTVRTGDTWKTIADGVLDNPRRAFELELLNPGVDRLTPGLRLRVPTSYDLFFKAFH